METADNGKCTVDSKMQYHYHHIEQNHKRRRMEYFRRAIVFQKENTMKRIITVQDISCVGKCSLTVALPVISAMGVEAAILPTAVLSTDRKSVV